MNLKKMADEDMDMDIRSYSIPPEAAKELRLYRYKFARKVAGAVCDELLNQNPAFVSDYRCAIQDLKREILGTDALSRTEKEKTA
jgi:hypothetical protein